MSRAVQSPLVRQILQPVWRHKANHLRRHLTPTSTSPSSTVAILWHCSSSAHSWSCRGFQWSPQACWCSHGRCLPSSSCFCSFHCLFQNPTLMNNMVHSSTARYLHFYAHHRARQVKNAAEIESGLS